MRNIWADTSATYLHSCPLKAPKQEGDQGQHSFEFKQNKLLRKNVGKEHTISQFEDHLCYRNIFHKRNKNNFFFLITVKKMPKRK